MILQRHESVSTAQKPFLIITSSERKIIALEVVRAKPIGLGPDETS